MKKEIILSALDMSSTAFLAQGVWAHPGDRSTQMNSLDYWLDYARLLERGLFDMMFFADIIGSYDVYGGSAAAAVRCGAQTPLNDPFMALSGMAAVTKNLCFGVSGNPIYEPPYLFARRMSTLDHLLGGRIGWNIVTGVVASGARAMGRDGIVAHDERYDMADEYLDLMYRLWEGSWDQDAVVLDRANHIFANPDKVRPIRHKGKYYRLEGIHPCTPSPQRSPVIIQAGASGRGKLFAAGHAECVFINGTSRDQVRANVADIRSHAVAAGRQAGDVKILSGVCVIVGKTDAEAQEKLHEYRSYGDPVAALVHLSSGLGIDLSTYPLDEPIRYQENDANRTAMETLTRNKDRTYTPRQIADEMTLSARNPLIVGSVETVVNELAAWMEHTDIDGFNLGRMVMPASYRDFIDLVVPALQERGIYKTAYREGTMRDKLFGRGPHLAAPHPAAMARSMA